MRAAVLAVALAMATAAMALVSPGAGASSAAPGPVSSWLTSGDASQLLAPQAQLTWSPDHPSNTETVTVDPSTTGQTVDGFGASLTDSSAWLLSQLSTTARTAALTSLFGTQGGNGFSVVRVPMGASDFALSSYTYDDQPPGATDPSLSGFSIAHDLTYIVPILKQARQINPALRIMATPWSPPAWMKTSGSLNSGTLLASAMPAYATYFVKFLQAYAANGVAVQQVAVQNEPENQPWSYPGMLLSEPDEAAFVVNYLRPALDNAGLGGVGIIGYDHNWSDTTYPSAEVQDPSAGPAIVGTSYHCYSGDPSAQSTVHSLAPSKAIYLTECSGGGWSTSFPANLVWGTRNLVIGGTRNWAKTVLTWNLALDPTGGPTNGGCSNCRGVVTIDPSTGTVTNNVEYWFLGQASRFAHQGAVRIASTTFGNGNIETTAFRNPDGSTVLVAVNSGTSSRTFKIKVGSSSITTTLAASGVVTYRW